MGNLVLGRWSTDVLQISEPAQLSPVDLILPSSLTDVLIGQNGAVLTNTVWMQSSGSVIEIAPSANQIGRWNSKSTYVHAGNDLHDLDWTRLIFPHEGAHPISLLLWCTRGE